jgi:hypothetical protein
VLSMRLVSERDFEEVLEHAPPGVFDARSWAYWNLKCGRAVTVASAKCWRPYSRSASATRGLAEA